MDKSHLIKCNEILLGVFFMCKNQNLDVTTDKITIDKMNVKINNYHPFGELHKKEIEKKLYDVFKKIGHIEKP